MIYINGKADLYSMTMSELSDFLNSIGEPKFRAKQIAAWLALGTPISEMSNLSKSLREKLSELTQDTLPKVREKLVIAAEATQEEAIAAAKSLDKIADAISGMTIVKELYVKGRLVNIVVRP